MHDFTFDMLFNLIEENAHTCKNCKFLRNYEGTDKFFYCEKDKMQTLDNSFCSLWKGEKSKSN